MEEGFKINKMSDILQFNKSLSNYFIKSNGKKSDFTLITEN